MKNKIITLVVLGLLLIILPACQRQSEGGPLELIYTAPFETGIERGGGLPGTGIRYVGSSDKGAEILIDDQTAFKQKGDSLGWKGDSVENVHPLRGGDSQGDRARPYTGGGLPPNGTSC